MILGLHVQTNVHSMTMESNRRIQTSMDSIPNLVTRHKNCRLDSAIGANTSSLNTNTTYRSSSSSKG